MREKAGPGVRLVMGALMVLSVYGIRGPAEAAVRPVPCDLPAKAVFHVPERDTAFLLLARGGGGGGGDHGGSGHAGDRSRTYREWQSLTRAEKKALRQRMKRLKQMSSRDRQQFNRMFRKWQSLSPLQRLHIKKSLDNWSQLSEQQKQQLREQFRD